MGQSRNTMIRWSVLTTILFLSIAAQAQNVGINANGAVPDASAMLDIAGQNGGLLIPRLTTAQRNAIAIPATSLLIFNTTTARFEYFDGALWVPLVGGGTLDQAYDFGGAGAGRTIIADAGAVTIAGNDGLVSSGTFGSGAVAPTGSGVRMVWNPNKAAFRAGRAWNTDWDDANMGAYSAAFGSAIASGAGAMAWGDYNGTRATAANSTAWGFGSIASAQNATAWGYYAFASGYNATAWGGYQAAAVGSYSNAIGHYVRAESFSETAFGHFNTSYTPQSTTAWHPLDRLFSVGNGTSTAARSDALVIRKNGYTGIGTSTPAANLHVRFPSPVNNINGMLRLEAAQVGTAASIYYENSITNNSASMGMLANGDFGLHMGCNFGGCATGTEAFRVKPNGNFGIGTANALDRLHVEGSIRMVDGNQAAGRVLATDANGTGSWTDMSAVIGNAGWSLTGNTGTTAGTHFIGTTDGQGLAFRTQNTERMRVSNTGFVGINTATPNRRLHVLESNASTTLAQLLIEQSGTGDAFLNMGLTGGRHYSMGVDNSDSKFKLGTHATIGTAVTTGTIFTLQPTGEFGLGTVTPDQHMEISGTGNQYLRVTSTNGTIAGIELKRAGGGSDWQMRDETGLLFFGQSNDDLATVVDVLRLGGGSVTPAADNIITLGQSTLRWTNVFATSGVVNTSDARDKTDVQAIGYGLAEVLRLRPVSFTWKDMPEEGTKLGLIAQELQRVLPEVVRDWDHEVAEDGTHARVPAERLGVYYSDLIPVLVKAIQEQEARIDQLQAELEVLRNR